MKFKKLQRRLGLRKYEIVGLLETLWIVTQENAPRGDIGQFDDEEIAIEMDWYGEPTELIDALVETGWLVRTEEHRLVVNDWHEHAPRYVHGVVARCGGFVTAESDGSPELQSATTVVDCSDAQPNLTKPNPTERGPASAPRSPNRDPQPETSPPQRKRTSGAAKPKFKPPTVDEVRQLCQQKQYAVDPELFVAHYEANGWKQASGRPIANWQAAVVTWERRSGQHTRAGPADEGRRKLRRPGSPRPEDA